MTDIDRAVVEWTGFPGAPGISVFYATPGGGVAFAIGTMFELLKNFIPLNVTITVPASGDTIDDATGEIVGTWTTGAESVTHCSASGTYAAAGGGLIRWATDGLVNGHRVKGRTFFVPLDGDLYEDNGSLSPTWTGNAKSAGDNLIEESEGHLVIWSRPTPTRAGSSHTVVTCAVPDKMSVLRSRRD